MADKKKIGEVSVGVVPDADGFKEKAEAQLKKEQPRDLSVKFQAAPLEGGEQVVAEARAVSEAAQKAAKDITLKVNVDDVGSVQNAISRIQTELTNLGAKPFKIGLNEDDLNSFLDKFQEDLERISHVELKFDEADPASLKKAIKQIDRELEKLAPAIPVHLDEKSLRDMRKTLSDKLTEAARFELRIDKVNEASLKDAIKKIDAEITKMRPAELNVNAKLTEDSLQEAKARLQNELANTLRIKAKLDKAAFTKVTAEARALIDAQNIEAKIGTRIDAVKFNHAVTELALMLKAREDLNAKIGAELDPFAKAKLSQEFVKLDAEIQAFAPNVRVPITPTVSDRAKAAVAATLAAITRKRDITIDLDFKGALAQAGTFFAALSTFTAFNDSLREGRSLLTGMFTNLPNFAAATTGVLAMSGSVIALTSNLIGLAGSFVQLLPLMAAVPGIAIGMGVMAVALKDLPNQLPGIAQGFKDLQGVISESFWAVARGPINALATEALPLISAGLEQTSGKIGGFFAALSGSLSGGFMDALPGMFDKLSESIGIFSAHTPAIANILTMFGQLGSGLLPPLATLMGQIVDQFSAWFAQKTAGDGMNQMIQGAIGALSGLFEIVKGVAGIFGALFEAASAGGATTFGALGLALQQIADILHQVQPALIAFFSAAHTMFDNFFSVAQGGFQNAFTGIAAILSSVLPTVGNILGEVVNILGGLLSDPAMVQGFSSLVGGILLGVQALAPAIQPVASLIGALGPVLGVLATQIGQTFAALAPSFGGVLQALLPLVNILSGGFQTILVALSPIISQLADVLAEALANPAIQQAVTALVNAIVALLPALSPIIALAPLFVEFFGGILVAVLEPLAGLFTQLVPLFGMLAGIMPMIYTALAPLIPMLVDLLVTVLVPLIPLLLQIVTAILPIIPPLVQLFSNSLQIVMTVLQLLIAAVLPVITFSLGLLATAIGAVVSVISALFLPALQWVQDGIAKLQAGIEPFAAWWQGLWQKVLDFFKGIWESVVNWVKDFLGIHSPSRVFLDIANNLIDGLLNGLKAGWKAVVSFFTSAFNWVVDTARNAIDRMVDFYGGLWGKVTGAIGDLAGKVRSFFGTAFGKIYEALTSAWTTVSGWLGGLGSRILSTIGNLNSLLLGAGKAIMNSLWDGLKAVWDNVAGWLGGLGDKIKGLKGPEDYDAVLLVHAGELIIQGLLEGMESQYDAVRKSLAGFTNEIGGTRFGSPAVALGVSASSYAGSDGTGTGNTLIYHAAPGSSLGAEEDLYSAIGRARAFGW